MPEDVGSLVVAGTIAGQGGKLAPIRESAPVVLLVKYFTESSHSTGHFTHCPGNFTESEISGQIARISRTNSA